jgi:hypothetical protein
MPQSPWTAFLEVQRLARYLLTISQSSEPVPLKNDLAVEVPVHLYLVGRGVHELMPVALSSSYRL